MATEHGPSLAELDEVLSRAIDRQIAEQRALRQQLEDLQETIRTAGAARGQAPQIDILAIGDSVRDSVRLAIDTGIGRLEKSLRDIRAELGPALDEVSAVAGLRTLTEGVRGDVRSVAEGVGVTAADVRGLAQALIDLNAGLRGWADEMEKGVDAVRLAVEAPGGGRQLPPDEARKRLDGMQEQIKETADLSLYLTDQIEDLDAVLNRLGELPDKVEGVVTQAMRRTLTARAKIEQDASSVLDDVSANLEGTVERMSEVLDLFEGGDIRRLALAQVELSSRIESMHATLIDRISDVETGYRQMLEALARAIDRSARGQEPHALETVAKAVIPQRRPAPQKKKKTTAKAKGKRSRRASGRSRPDDTES